MDALRAWCAGHAVDRRRVIVAGEGTGALLAFDLALRAPGLVRGVLLVQGPALLQDVRTRALTAAALGVRVGVWVDPDRPVPWTAPGITPTDYAQELGRRLAGLGRSREGSVRLDALPASEEDAVSALAEALRAVTP